MRLFQRLALDQNQVVIKSATVTARSIDCLMYGSGLRLMECLRLRVKDIEFAHRAIFVRDGKGGKDRVVTLADELLEALARHLKTVRTLHERDVKVAELK